MSVQLVPETGRWVAPAGSANLAQYQFVTFNGSGQLVTPSSGVFAVVLDDAPSNANATFNSSTGFYSGGYVVGRNYGYVFQGVMKVFFGGTVAAGQPVMSDGSGHAIVATGAGNVILGWALEAHVSGDLGPILLDRSLHN